MEWGVLEMASAMSSAVEMVFIWPVVGCVRQQGVRRRHGQRHAHCSVPANRMIPVRPPAYQAVSEFKTTGAGRLHSHPCTGSPA
jgi:hypothetical protein